VDAPELRVSVPAVLSAHRIAFLFYYMCYIIGRLSANGSRVHLAGRSYSAALDGQTIVFLLAKVTHGTFLSGCRQKLDEEKTRFIWDMDLFPFVPLPITRSACLPPDSLARPSAPTFAQSSGPAD